MRLRARFTFLFAALAALAGIFLVAVSDATLRRAVHDRVAERFRRELEHLTSDLARVPLDAEGLDAFLRRSAAELECRITDIAPGGRVRHDTDLLPADVPGMENHARRPEVLEALATGTGSSQRTSPTEQKPMLYVARRLPDGGVLRLAIAQARLQQVELGYLWTMRLATFAVCLLLFLIGAGASRRFSEPVAELTRAASAVAAGDFARDLPTAGGEEVQLLGAAMQRMKGALNQAVQRAESERRLTAMVFERLPDGLVVVDAKLRVLEANGRFADMTGIPAPAGRGIWEVLRERPLHDCFEATVHTGEHTEKTVRLPDDRVWQIAVAPLPDAHRAAAVGVLRDVTRIERTEAMRRTFVADVSHELRTPIASIAAAAETLADSEPDRAESAELLGLIRRQSDRMRELIDDLMDLAQIESGAVPLVREAIPLRELLAEVAEDLEPAARDLGVSVRVQGDEAITAMGDRRRVGQLARNLIDNAIKFSPRGAPVVVRVFQQGGRTGFSVEDLGPGIPKSERDKIFQRFYQVDRSRSKMRPGSGLGLAIVKHIAQLHGAIVDVEGEAGEGSTFRVSFPAAA
ncbi:MAG TPA: ATP-binding protein [Thermoanaerobaculia bacterium]|jgi:two-component system phosphate regulon sensor histidine kinase PhoR|nr:ATP-binding protein [Thermoanaerobaculia bacterium]